MPFNSFQEVVDHYSNLPIPVTKDKLLSAFIGAYTKAVNMRLSQVHCIAQKSAKAVQLSESTINLRLDLAPIPVPSAAPQISEIEMTNLSPVLEGAEISEECISKVASTLPEIIEGTAAVPGVGEIVAAVAVVAVVGLAFYEIFRGLGKDNFFVESLAQAEKEHQDQIDQIKKEIQQREIDEQKRAELNQQLIAAEDLARAQQKAKDDKERADQEQIKARENFYCGRIHSIEKLETVNQTPLGDFTAGYEIIIDCVAENVLTYGAEFLAIVDQQGPAAALLSALVPTHLISVYTRKPISSFLQVGVWVNFNFTSSGVAADARGIDDNFSEYAAIQETFVPTVKPDWIGYYLAATSLWGQKGQVVGEIVVDMPTNLLQIISKVFSSEAGHDNFNSYFTSSVCEKFGFNTDIVIENPTSTCIQNKLNGSDRGLDGHSHGVTVFDVGQGACMEVHSNNTNNLLFFSDFGYGTRNDGKDQHAINAQILSMPNAPILISHWHKDHYNIALIPSSASLPEVLPCDRVWIGPPNTIAGPSLLALLSSIKKVVLWPENGLSNIAFNNIQIGQTPGTSETYNDKNNCYALILLLGNTTQSTCFLYTGDASYKYVPNIQSLSSQLTHLVAAHHGSYSTAIDGVIPRARNNDGTILYSYGSGNSYGHSEARVRSLYANNGWVHAHTTENQGNISISWAPTIAPHTETFIEINESPAPLIEPQVTLTQDSIKAYTYSSSVGTTVHVQAKEVIIGSDIIFLNDDDVNPLQFKIECQTFSVQKPNLTINISGKAGADLTSVAPTPNSPPSEPTVAQTGNNGFSGGSFILKCEKVGTIVGNLNIVAEGGKGGQGQGGYIGQDGKNGDNGIDDTGGPDSCTAGKDGTVGEPGADGGIGGKGGQGANGGSILIGSTADVSTHFSVYANGGAAGAGGVAGQGGKGGIGGAGRIVYIRVPMRRVYDYNTGGWVVNSEKSNKKLPDGSPGKNGALGNPGSPGENGTKNFSVVSREELYANFDVSEEQIRLSAQTHFAANSNSAINNSQTAEFLIWLQAIAKAKGFKLDLPTAISESSDKTAETAIV